MLEKEGQAETDLIDKIALRQVLDTLNPREKQIIFLGILKKNPDANRKMLEFHSSGFKAGKENLN